MFAFIGCLFIALQFTSFASLMEDSVIAFSESFNLEQCPLSCTHYSPITIEKNQKVTQYSVSQQVDIQLAKYRLVEFTLENEDNKKKIVISNYCTPSFQDAKRRLIENQIVLVSLPFSRILESTQRYKGIGDICFIRFQYDPRTK